MAEQAVSKVPRIRFKGFKRDWGAKLLGEIVLFLDERRKPLKAGSRKAGPYPYYGASGIIDYVEGYLFDERLLLLSEDGANIIDRNYPICFIADRKYWVNNHAHVLRPNLGFSDVFISNSLERLNFEKFNTGTAQPKLNQEVCRNISIKVTEPAEQTQIGTYFRNLDRLIDLHQRKHDKLMTLKNAMLQKMFPQPGASTPEIRFKGFEGDWYEKSFHQLADRYDYLRIPVTARNRVFGNIPYYGANGIQDYVRGFTHEGEFVLVAEDGANDLKNYPVQYVNGKIWVNNHAHVLQGKDGQAQTRFLKYAFSQINFEVFLVGGGRAKLNAETMMQLKLCVPDIAEQQKIGTYFRTLDELIAKYAIQLKKLKQIKSACLEKMFV